MSARPHISISREGRYYLFVLGFIIGGAVLREVNLLVVLAALMIGPLAFGWRMVVMSLRGLRATRQLPDRVSAGDTVTVRVVVANQRKRLATWALVAEDRVERVAPQFNAKEDTTTAQVIFPCVAAGEEQGVSYRLALSRRGRYRLGPLELSTGFPFGFLRGSLRESVESEVLAVPRVGRLTRRWHQQLESMRVGQQRSRRRRGMGDGDYYGLREWRPGDSRRWIHWRTSAKVGGLSVLQFEEVRHQDLALVVDLWQPDEPSDEDAAQVELAVSFAATVVVEVGQRGVSQLAVAVTGANLDCWSAQASRTLSQQILGRLAVVEAARKPDLAGAIERIEQRMRTGARVLIISTRPAPGEGNSTATLSGDSLSAIGPWEWFNVRSPQVRQYLELDVANG